MATEPNYDINYEDERFKQVEAEKNAALIIQMKNLKTTAGLSKL